MTNRINYCTTSQLADYCENGQLEIALRGFIREYHGRKDIRVTFGDVCTLRFPGKGKVRMDFSERYEAIYTRLTYFDIKRFNRQKIESLARRFANDCGEVFSEEYYRKSPMKSLAN